MIFTGNFDPENLKKSKKRFYTAGAIMTFIGFISLIMPLLASFAIETLVGFLLLSVGFGNAISAYRAFKEKETPWQEIFMALISFAAAFIFLLNPLAGIMTLSFLLSLYFLIDGVVKLVEYFRLRALGGSLWVLISGLLGILLAFMMWKNFFTGAVLIGTILGIDLIFGGISLIMLGRGCSEAEKRR